MHDSIHRISDAVLAVPGVVGLAEDPDALAPAGSVGFVDPDDEAGGPATSVHVQIDAEAPVRVIAERVQQAAHEITGGRVDVTIEEVR